MGLVLGSELICVSEVVRISLGQLRGDLPLGITIHYTRLLMWFVALTHPAVSDGVAKMILLGWAVTEVGRYPMIMTAGSVPSLKVLRYAVPLVTFPLTAGAEAYAAYCVLPVTKSTSLKVVLGLVILVNVFGGSAWYPKMV